MGEFDFLNDEKKPNKSKPSNRNKNINLDEVKSKTTNNKQQNNNTQNNKNQFDQNGWLKNSSDLEKYIQQLKQNEPDPRPDIKEDHYIWIYLFRTAKTVHDNAHNILHYLRCCGCRLKMVRKENGTPFIKLALEKSQELLEEHMSDELGQQYDEINEQMNSNKLDGEQLSMFDSSGKNGLKSNKIKLRERNKKLSKQRQKILEKARQRILDEVIMISPYKKLIMATLTKFQHVAKSVEKEIGYLSFNFTKFNNYLGRKWENEQRKRKEAT